MRSPGAAMRSPGAAAMRSPGAAAREQPPLTATREKPACSSKDPPQPKIKINKSLKKINYNLQYINLFHFIMKQ